jgi:NADH-quinone oxidoreductase subunit L
VLLGVFVTAFYSFRLLFMTFHGKNRSDEHTRKHLHESPKVVTLPLIALAIPSIIAGFLYFGPVISGEFFGDSIFVLGQHDVTAALAEGYPGKTGFDLAIAAMTHGVLTLPFWLALGGVCFAWYCYCKNTELPGKIATASGPLYRILENKYGFDDFYQSVFTRGTLVLGKVLNRKVDAGLIDGLFVNGTANTVAAFSAVLRHIQTGYTYHYAFAMIIGLFALVTVFVWL